MIRVFPTLREPTLPEFLATDQHAARWLADMRAAVVRVRLPPAVRGDQFLDALVWLAATGVAPVVGAGADAFVPNLDPEKVVVRDDTAGAGAAGADRPPPPRGGGGGPPRPRGGGGGGGGRRAAAPGAGAGAPAASRHAPAEGEAAYHAVVQWMPPVHDGRERMRFTSPLAVAYTAHCRALLRYGAVEDAAALRLNAPLMFARPAGSDAASPITASPAAVLDPARDAAGCWGAREERGTYARYHPGAARAVLQRLHRGASYANIVNHLLRPGRLLPPFDASHAEGIASAATAVLRLLGHRAVVRADRQFLAPAAKRANVDDDPDDTRSDDNED